MATEVGTAYVTLVPSAKGFAQKMQRELGGDLARAGQQGGSSYGASFSESGKQTIGSRAKGMFSGMAKAGITGAVVAGAAIGKVLFDSINAASDMDETLAKAGQLFGAKALPGLEAWAEGAATAMGQSKQQALDAAATFAIFGKSAGLTGKDLSGFSQRFTGLASDLASFNNTTPQEAIDAIGAALRGETEPIRRYGVMLDDASLRQEALRQGLIKTTKEALTPQQKTLAAQALIYKQTKDAQGDFSRTSGGLANQQRTLSAQWENMKTRLGRGLLPVVLKLITWANDMVPKLSDLAGVVKRDFGPAMEAAGKVLSDLFSGGGGAGDTLGWFRDNFSRLQEIVRGAVEVVTAIWQAGWGEHFLSILGSAFEAVKGIITGAMQVIQGVIDVVMGLIKGDWGRVWEGIKGILRGVWTVLVAIVKHLWNTLKNSFQWGLTILRGIFSRLWGGLRALAAKGVGWLVGQVKAMPGRFRAVLSALPGILGGLLTRAWSLARSAVSKGVSLVVSGVKALPGKLLQLGAGFARAGRSIIGKFVDGLKNAAGVISGIAGNVWDAVRGMINGAIDKVNAALEFTIDLPGPKNLHVNIANIPHLATGGRATAATLAVIGEGREPETVLPDSVLRGLLERTAAAATTAPSLGGARLALVLADGTQLDAYIDERITTAEDLVGERRRAGAR